MEKQTMRRVGQTLGLTIASIAVILWSWHFGVIVFLLVGMPIATVGLAVAGGARPPWRIPARDYLLYLAIAVVLVLGILAYAKYSAMHGL